MCEEVVSRASAAGATVIVNDRADIARLAKADGVHVGQDDLEPAAARRILGDARFIGLSTHTLEQVRGALAQPVDYIAIGPVFATLTKETGYSAIGIGMVREARALIAEARDQRPLVAIGGITLGNARDVVAAGAASVAVISDLLASGNPEERCREYLRLLGRHA